MNYREQLLAGIPASERQLELAGISTSVLEGGEGTPMVLLHEQGSFAAHWMRVIPSLVETNRVIAPDLPGHGASEIGDVALDADRVLAWLSEVIEHTCASPPVLVGHMAGGSIAARFAVEHDDRLSSLVLVDSFGLGKFRPAPRFALALVRYVTRPSDRAYDGLMERCTVDFGDVRAGIGARWEPFKSYTLDRARAASGKAALRVLMKEIGVPQIAEEHLGRIGVPTTLIWGRQDPMMRLKVARAASARFHWPLHVIDDAGDDPPIERPDAFLRALQSALTPGRS